ncbi:hypothetical protein AAY473_033431 [Plecturocebus cupreus]
MTTTSPSVFLLMVNGQVESAQVSGRGPRRGPPPQRPPGPFPQPRGLPCGPQRATPFRASPLGGGGKPALEGLARGFRDPEFRCADVEADLEMLS